MKKSHASVQSWSEIADNIAWYLKESKIPLEKWLAWPEFYLFPVPNIVRYRVIKKMKGR